MPPSLLMTVGRKFYKLYEIIEEAEDIGVSKRIPVTAIPEGMVKGASKIFLAHPDAIVKVTAEGKTLQDLAYRLVELNYMTQAQFAKLVDTEEPFWTGKELQPDDFVPECMLDITFALSQVIEPVYTGLIEDFGLEFCMGVFGWAPFSGFEYVLPNDKNELPPELAHLEGYLEPVHVKYIDDDGEAGDEEHEGNDE